MTKYIYIFLTILLFCSCKKIQSGENLKKADIEFVRSLGLLDDKENIIKFHSNYKNRVEGNFFTNKRVASYWLDEYHEEKRNINTAYYEDILSLDTVFYAGFTYSPYIKVTKSDKTEFKVYVDGEIEEIKSFYEDIISLWEQNKNNPKDK